LYLNHISNETWSSVFEKEQRAKLKLAMQEGDYEVPVTEMALCFAGDFGATGSYS
jgi:hypothetical protein